MPILTVSIAYERSQRAWVVRRAQTVVKAYASRNEALHGACEAGVQLRERMHCDMRYRVRDGLGDWHVYAAMNDDRCAADVAARLVHTCRRRMPKPFVVFWRQSPLVLYGLARSVCEIGRRAVTRQRPHVATRQ